MVFPGRVKWVCARLVNLPDGENPILSGRHDFFHALIPGIQWLLSSDLPGHPD
jgi:hypothetical protein